MANRPLIGAAYSFHTCAISRFHHHRQKRYEGDGEGAGEWRRGKKGGEEEERRKKKGILGAAFEEWAPVEGDPQ